MNEMRGCQGGEEGKERRARRGVKTISSLFYFSVFAPRINGTWMYNGQAVAMSVVDAVVR